MNITHKHVDEIFEYDGSQINPSWAFQEFGIYGSSIITWIGPVNITPDNLKDVWPTAYKHEGCLFEAKAFGHDI